MIIRDAAVTGHAHTPELTQQVAVPESHITALLGHLDQNGDCVIDFPEFLEGLKTLHRRLPPGLGQRPARPARRREPGRT